MLRQAENGQTDLLIIKDRLESLNNYIDKERTNRYAAASIKRKQQKMIGEYIEKAVKAGNLHRHDRPVAMFITWTFPDHRRRDLDNQSFAIKFVQDALVDAGVFPDDNIKVIREIHHRAVIQSGVWKVEVEIKEITNE